MKRSDIYRERWNQPVMNDLTGRSLINALFIYMYLFSRLGLKKGSKIVIITKDIEQMSLLLLSAYIKGLDVLVINTEDNEKSTASRIISFFPEVIFCERRSIYNELENDLENFHSIPTLKLILSTGVVLSNNIKFDLYLAKTINQYNIIRDDSSTMFTDNINDLISITSDIFSYTGDNKIQLCFTNDTSLDFEKLIKAWIDERHTDLLDHIGSNSISLNLNVQRYPYLLLKTLVKGIPIVEQNADVYLFDSESFEVLWNESIESVKQNKFRRILYLRIPFLYRWFVEKTIKHKLGKFNELIIINPEIPKNILNLLGKSKLPVSTITILRNEYDPAFYNRKGKDLATNDGLVLRNSVHSRPDVLIKKDIVLRPSSFFQWLKKLFGFSYLKKTYIQNKILGYQTDILPNNIFATDIESMFIACPLVKDAVCCRLEHQNQIFILLNDEEIELMSYDSYEINSILQTAIQNINKSLADQSKIYKLVLVDEKTLVKSNTGKVKKYLYRGMNATFPVPETSFIKTHLPIS